MLAIEAEATAGLLMAGVYGPASLYISRDFGRTWRIPGGDPGAQTSHDVARLRGGVDGQPVHVLMEYGEGELLAGTATGLYAGELTTEADAPVWTRVEDWPAMRAVYDMDHASNGDILIAGAWSALLRYSGNEAHFSEPVVSPATWQPGGILSVLALENGLLLAGTDGNGLFTSADAGVTWQQVEEIGATFVAALRAAEWDAELVLARTRDGLYRSRDGGESWEAIGRAIEGRPDALLTLPATRDVLVGMSTGRIYAGRVEGDTWEPWGEGLPRDGLFQTLTRIQQDDGATFWAGTQNGLYFSSDNGQTWTLHAHVGRPALSTLAVGENGSVYVGSHDGVYRSDDHGISWARGGRGLPPRAVKSLALDPHTPDRIYAGLDGGGLWRSDDAGEHWEHFAWDARSIPEVVVDRSDPARLYVRMAFERIYTGLNGGEEWMANWDGMDTDTEIMSLAQSSHDPEVLFAGGAIGLYRSRDRAANWESIGPDLAGQSIFFLAIDHERPSVIYAGATNGLHISLDEGDSWARWGAGLEDRTVTALVRHPNQDRLWYAGTKYAGIYRSDDNGETWHPDFVLDATISGRLNVDAMGFAPDGEYLYAATNQGFLLKETGSPVADDAVTDEDAVDGAMDVPPTHSAHDEPLVERVAPRGKPRYGMHTVSTNPAMLPFIHAAGFDTVVQLFPWWEVEPTRGRFIWQPWDEAVAAAEYYGLNLIIRLDKHPDWAKPERLEPGAPPVEIAEYGRFVRLVSERYRGRVAGYIIWNEPNLALEWSDLPPDPASYVSILQAGYEAVKAADPDAVVVSAGLAPTNTRSEDALDDRLFLEAMYAHGAQRYFDVLGAHPYGYGRPPDDPAGTNDSLNMIRLEELRAIMARYGDEETPVWITEMGWSVAGNEHMAGQTVSLQDQARYWVEALAQIRRDWPFVELITVWNLGGQDHPEWGGYSLLGPGGQPRPAYRALAAAMRETYGTRNLPRQEQPTEVSVLAPDAVVHLGDSPHLGRPWEPIYRALPISAEWEGLVYLHSVDDGSVGDEPWLLTMRVMQSNFWSNVIWINGAPLPDALPVEDFSRSWVAYTVPVPADMLRPGPNTIALTIAQAPPLIQARNFAYDELQIKDIVLRRHD